MKILSQQLKDSLSEEFIKWHSAETTFAYGAPDERTITEWWIEKFAQELNKRDKELREKLILNDHVGLAFESKEWVKGYINKMKTKLQELRKEIIKAVPEIVELKFGCKVKYQGEVCRVYNEGHDDEYIMVIRGCGAVEKASLSNFEIIGRDITLEDVVKAIVKNHKWKFIMSYSSFGCILSFNYNHYNKGRIFWQLGEPLHLQSEETIEFLQDLIFK